MSDFFILLIASLGVFRCAEMVAVDNGPFHVFKKLRAACEGHPLLCELVTCMYCLGGWMSILAATWLAWVGLIHIEHALLWWGGIWGGQAAVLRTVRERK